MALERFYRLPAKRREQILGTAAEAFAEGGYDGTSFNKLLERLGFSKSQAYYYFSDKADLFATACAACHEQYYALVAQLPLPETREAFWEYVLELNRMGFHFQNEHPMAARLSRAAAGSAQRDELARAGVRHAGSTHERYAEWLTLGQRLGAVRSDLPQEFLISLSVQTMTFIDAWFSGLAGATSPGELERLARSVTDLCWRLLHPAATPAGEDAPEPNAPAKPARTPRRAAKTLSSRKKVRPR
jgi:AcrR family transcriptional regulator